MVSLLDVVKGYLSSLMAVLTMLFIRPIVPPKLPKYAEDLDLHKKRVIITGATGGIGKELVLFYASHGAEVFLLCRSEEKGNKAKADVQAMAANENIFVEVVDNSSLASVNAFLKKWAKKSPSERRIDIIHNNAGGTHAKKKTTEDGFESTYQSNFLSAFLLTTSLLNMGAIAPDARIIQTCSTAAFTPNGPSPSYLNSEDVLGKVQEGGKLSLAGASSLIYGRAKAVQWVWTNILQEKLTKTEKYKDVVVQCCHPGWVATGFWTDPSGVAAHPYLAKLCSVIGAAIGTTPAQGAVTPIFLATSARASEPENRGKFWDTFGWRWAPGWMTDEQLRDGFWKKWQSDAGVQVGF
ncbi:hypothetical protein FRB95_007135 [Tulasnella sp. JGI-2019a]|nr:hypothetical protein FRB93_013576 [Tulasnella sp. JGI-2019a]KAG9039708.1 hypothetical protein FRB95_007135 [Tulasnella sp. JGI-2019a]